MDLVNDRVDAAREYASVLERGNVDHQPALSIAPGNGSPVHIPQFRSIGRTRQKGAQDADAKRQGRALVATDRQDKTM
jgi:hypothetical protein